MFVDDPFNLFPAFDVTHYIAGLMDGLFRFVLSNAIIGDKERMHFVSNTRQTMCIVSPKLSCIKMRCSSDL